MRGGTTPTVPDVSMKRTLATLACALVAAGALWAQAPKASMSGQASPQLEQILKDMDRAAASFKSAEADFEADQYTKIVDETDVQKGKVYFRRSDKDLEMAMDIREPDAKYVVFSGGKVDVYQPKIEQVTEYNAGKNKADFESFLVLGFGGSGQDLVRSFDVKYAGQENVLGVNAAKLELTPKSQRVRGMFSTISMWIDPQRGVSVQQQFFEPSGDYRLAKYSNIKVNEKVDASVFKLKTSGKTKWVKPQ